MAVRAPELAAPGGVWLNTPAPLTLAGLRGRILVLDFWTGCCVNCLHVLPALAKLEAAFPRDVVIIGIHSPKFPHEQDPATARDAVARLGITHPVLHDPGRHLWNQYAVRAWPTLVFVDPNGYVLGQASGEPDPATLLQTIRRMVRAAAGLGDMQPADLDLLTPPPAPPTRFRYPGKIRPIPGRARDAACWALADAGHHQIVLLDDGGTVMARIGSGVAGAQDGSALRACFRDPQGVAADAETLWVADTGNHLIRRVDLASGEVTTVAGTGLRGGALGAAAPALDTALASPWDLVPFGGGVLFANAGTHQLGALDPAGEVERLAGTGVEHLQDGPAAETMLAQPSGLALDGARLFFADSETSAVRLLDLDTMEVSTLAGAGLFDFGARNGALPEAQFQHPLGVAMLGEHTLLVADSYNNRVRLVDLWERTVSDLDDGFTCRDRVCLPEGGEPAGVCADPRAPGADPRILVVETTRHRVLEVRPARRSYRTWAE